MVAFLPFFGGGGRSGEILSCIHRSRDFQCCFTAQSLLSQKIVTNGGDFIGLSKDGAPPLSYDTCMVWDLFPMLARSM